MNGERTPYLRRRWAALRWRMRTQFGLLAGVASLIAVAVIYSSIFGVPSYAASLDTALSLATLAVAGLIWWGEVYQDWHAQLPLVLTVRVFASLGEREQLVVTIPEQRLMHSGDVRALAQQMAKQCNDNKDLPLSWGVDRTGVRDGVELDPDGEWRRHFQVRLWIREIPEALSSRGLPFVWSPDVHGTQHA